MAEPRPLRGALLGLGGIARNGHLAGLARDPALAARLRFTAAYDPFATADTVDGIRVVRTLGELEALGPFDVVDVCAPSAFHGELVRWGLAHGAHVLCEKPVATTRAEADALAALARGAGRVLFPCHQYRHNPAWRWIRKRLEGGAIGRWHLAEFQVWRLEADRGAGAAGVPWRGRRDGGGGVLLDHGTHLLYLVLDVAGVPLHVHGWLGRVRHRDYDVEDTTQLLLEYPDRAVTFFLTWAAARRETRIRFVGERGMIEWSGGWVTLAADGREEQVDFSAQLDKASYAGWYTRLLADFLDAVAAGDREPALADLVRVADLLERAAEAGRPVPA